MSAAGGAVRLYERVGGSAAGAAAAAASPQSYKFPIVEKLIAMYHTAYQQGVDISEIVNNIYTERPFTIVEYTNRSDITDLERDIQEYTTGIYIAQPTLPAGRTTYENSMGIALMAMIAMASEAQIDVRKVYEIVFRMWGLIPAEDEDDDIVGSGAGAGAGGGMAALTGGGGGGSGIDDIDIIRRARDEVGALEALNSLGGAGAAATASPLPPAMDLNSQTLTQLRELYNIYKEHLYTITTSTGVGQLRGYQYIDAIIKSKTRRPDGTTPYVDRTIDTIINDTNPISDDRKSEITPYLRYLLEKLGRLHNTEPRSDLYRLVMVTVSTLTKRLTPSRGGSRRTRRRARRSTKTRRQH